MDAAADDDDIRLPLSSSHIANRKVSLIVSRNQQGLLLMFFFAEFYAMEIICYTHCYPTRTVMVTIYVTGDMIELLYLITTSEIS